jgi:hypothetical protein
MAKLKYGEYVYKNLVKKSPHPEITAPMFSFKPKKKAGGTTISLEWCYIQQPVVLAKKRKVENLDRFLLFAGGDPLDLGDFKAEIEIALGEKGQVFKFNEPRVVYIPRGLAHYPLTIKKVDRPLMMLDITSTQEYPQQKINDYSKYITAPDIGTHTEVTRTIIDGNRVINEQTRTYKRLSYKGNEATGGGLTLNWYPISEPHVMVEPPHSHDHDMMGLALGGNPLNIAEFDAEFDMWLGEEGEKHTINSVFAVYHPKGLVHRSVDYQKVDKPFQTIHIFMTPEYVKARTL